MIRCIEEYAINAWPAFQTVLYDGWVLTFAGGYTRRANSVNPLYPSLLQLAEKIPACETLYFRHGLPICYKMTDACQPAGLDDALAEQGYTMDAPTSVQQLDLRVSPFTSFMTDIGPVEIVSALTTEWKQEIARISGLAPHRQAVHEQILAAILLPTAFAGVRQNGQLVACGLGVLQNGYLGLYDIVTDGTHRRQGLARRVIAGLFSWASAQNAHTAYLQVMLNNPPALSLYRSLGFKEIYHYWYRVKPLSESIG